MFYVLDNFNVFNVTRGQDPYAIWSFLISFFNFEVDIDEIE